MAHFAKKKAILAKVEVTYGVDSTPTGAANAILAQNVRLTTTGNEVSRNLDLPYMGAQMSLLVNVHRELSFEVEMAGSGDAGVAPAWGVLMLGSKHAEVVTEDEDVTYTPVSTSGSSLVIYVNLDGRRYKLLGCRGKLALRANAGEIPKLVFTFKGLFVANTDTAAPALTLTGWKDPLPVTDGYTPDFKVNGVDLKMRSFDFDNGGKVEGRFLVNQEEIIVTDHELSFNFDVERPLLASIDFEALAKAHTLVPVLLKHGDAAGKIVEVNLETSQLFLPETTEFQGINHDKIRGKAIPSAGNDDYSIKVA